jgi:hypothetical protein
MLFGSTLTKMAVSGALLAAPFAAAVSFNGEMPETASPPSVAEPLATHALLVATLSDGTIETQWLPRGICQRVASDVQAKETVTGLRSDGTRVEIARANCSLRNAQLAADRLFSERNLKAEKAR